ncbi:SPOR domain-containing protein [uncultured Roseobacter sp.]|uniref:SPOR domain-containing protein n=1 Tax=uncultured Roseobacter sp. TaxID=114847 RepID=UPI00263192A2|nr:SPOR domain-containing protein [uncultured Roseobacter sp.]
MADIEFSHGMGGYGRAPETRAQEPEAANSLTFMTNLAGAAVSLALIAGIGVWGYKLMVRDVSGIPVVRAAEGDMRVRPENPGGQLARHQGLAVNAIAAEGIAAGPVDQVVLAPRGAALSDEDQPVIQAAAPVELPVRLSPAQDAFEGVAPGPVASIDQAAAINELVEELTADTEPMETGTAAAASVPRDAVLQAAAEALPAPEPAVVSQTGLRVSARPVLRPARVQTAAFTPAPETAEIDPSRIPAGTRLAQLGAFESPKVARSEWDRLAGRFGDFMNGKSRVIEKAQSGGRTFYRLRVMGFLDLSDSRRFCAAFKAEGVDCIPVASR